MLSLENTIAKRRAAATDCASALAVEGLAAPGRWWATLLLVALALVCLPSLAAPFAYVTNTTANTVSVIDTANNTLVATISVGSSPKGVALHPDGTRVYVTNFGSNSLSVIDTSNNSVVRTIGLGSGPDGIAISADGSLVYVTTCGNNTVSSVDTATNEVNGTVTVTGCPGGILVSPDGARLYAARSTAGSVAVISVSPSVFEGLLDLTIAASVTVGTGPYQMAMHPLGTKVYVANATSATVSIIDTSTNTATTPFTGATGVSGMAVNNAGTRLYVADNTGLSVVDTLTNGVLTTVAIGNSARGVAVNADDSRVYVARFGTSDVVAVDTATNTVSATIAVGAGPLAFGRFLPTANLSAVKLKPMLAAGANHSLALKSDGSVIAWGANASGQLGLGTTADVALPTQVAGVSSIRDIAAGASHTVAVRSDGSIWAWGSNSSGQLGNGTFTGQAAPVQTVTPTSGATSYVAVAAGSTHSVALRADGTVWTWGANGSGQLGDNTTSTRASPVQVKGNNNVGFLTNIVAVAAGDSFSLAIGAGGAVWAWGANPSGQLGDGTSFNRHTPVRVQNLAGIIGIEAGSSHALALRFDGTVWSWGANASGQLGTGGTTPRLTPGQVTALAGVRAISAGGNHSAARLSDASVRLWGANSSGEIGNGLTAAVLTPATISAFGSANVITAGSANTLVLELDGSLWSTGRNDHGQVGDNTTVNRLSPVRVVGSGANEFLYVADTVPDLFPAQLRHGVPMGSLLTFNPVAVSGINAPTPISVKNSGTISIDGGPFQSGVQMVTNGQTVTVQVTSVVAPCETVVTHHLTIGGVSASMKYVTVPTAFSCATGPLTSEYSFTSVGCASGSAPCAALSESSFDLGSQSVGVGGAAPPVQLRNIGNSPLAVSSIAASGQSVSVTNDCGSSLGAGASCAINITFTPPVPGTNVGGVLIVSNSVQSPQTISLTGTGVQAAPGPATGVAASAGNTTATVSFTAPASNGGTPITGYTVVSNPAGGADSNAGSTALSHTVTGLTNGTAYTFTVTATNNTGTSASSAASNSVTPRTVPGAPTIGTASAGNASASLSFAAPANNGGAPITGYTVVSNPAGGVDSDAGTTALSHTITGLTNGIAYTFTVKAMNAAGSGPASAISNSVTPLLPNFALTVTNAGGGTVTGSPAGIICGAACSSSYPQGTVVTLTATPNPGFSMSGWSGACSGAGLCTVTVNAARTVTANFKDTQAPTVPSSPTASAVSGSQINLVWTAATDNVGVTAYQLYRQGVFRATVNVPALNFSDTGLTPSTAYSYRVAACDAAGNCSAQSAPTVRTTLASGQFAHSPTLEAGFNLGSNALNITLNVATIFGNQDTPVGGVTSNIVSVWKWNAVNGRWAFYSPQLTVAGNASYVASRNYDLLSAINAGEGYWVNAINPVTLPLQSGTGFTWTAGNFTALPLDFNLIATANVSTPSQFHAQVSITPPAFVSLWVWDAVLGKWYFYSPILETSGGLPAVKAYADSHNYLHFQDYSKTLGVGIGFWVNRP